MVAISLFQNYVGAWSGSTPNAVYTIGHEFIPGSDGQITHVRYYSSGGAANHPSRVAMYALGEPTPLAEVLSVGSPSVSAWNAVALATPLDVYSGQTYICAVDWPAAQGWYFIAYASRPVPPTYLAWGSYGRRFTAAGQTGYPGQADNSSPWGVDVTFVPGAVPPPSGSDLPSIGDVVTVVSSYVGSNYTDHPTSAISQIISAISDLQTDVTAIKDNAGTDLATAISGLASDLGDVKASVGTGLGSALASFRGDWDTWRGLWDSFVAQWAASFSWWGNLFDGISDWTGLKWVGVVGQWSSFIGRMLGSTPVPGSGWSLVAETTWTDDLAWQQPADVYVCSVTTLPIGRGTTDVAGVAWVPRLAWWAELNATQPGERHYMDFPGGAISMQGHRMAGLLFRCGPGGSGTMQAWQLAE